MMKRMLSWGLLLSLLLTMLPVSAVAAEDELAGDGLTVTESAQCICGTEPDEAGTVTHADSCPLYEAPVCTCGAEPNEAGIVIHTDGCPLAVQEEPPLETKAPPAEMEDPPAETEHPSTETEEPVLESLTPPVLTCEPLDETSSSDMVLTVAGDWDSYTWESGSYGFWSDWPGDGPSLILSKEDFTSYGFRCTVTRGEQSVTSETFAYDPSVLEQPAMMANGLSDDLLSGSSDYIKFGKRLPNSTFFNIKGLDNGYEIQTTYADAGYRTAISVDGGTKMSVFYRGEPTSVGNSLTAENRLEIVYGGRYVKVTYEVTNHGSTTQKFQIGSSADVMIDNNDHAKVVGVKSSTGKYTGLSMDGSPKNSYQFSLVAPDCDTLWYGYYSKAYINIFNNLSDKDTPYSKDSGMAWSWRGTVAPGQTWSRYVLIGAGELPPAPDAPLINNFPTLKAGETFTISGTVNTGGNPPDTVHVSIGGEEYEARVNEDGTFTVTGTLPEDTPAGDTTLTYWGTTDDGGISEIQSGSVTVVAAPYISLTADSVTVMEGETGLDETWLRGFIKSHSDTVVISPSTLDTNTPGEKTVTYTVAKEGFTPATVTLTVTVLPQPAALTQTAVSGTGTFALSAAMTYTGGLTYTETGFVYGALQNPTLDFNDGRVTTTTPVTTKGGAFSAAVEGSKLAYGVTYYARAYAIADDGTVIYGEQSAGFGMGTPSYGTFSVTGSGNTFTITRSGGTDGVQTVYYRTVNGSAIGGTHFEHQAGSVTFAVGETSKSITVTEKSVTNTYGGSAATAYSNADRTYFFEIYRVVGGATINSSQKSASRTMVVSNDYRVNADIFTGKSTIVKSGTTERGDAEKDSMGWTSNSEGNTANSKETVDITAVLPSQGYWKNLLDAKIWYRVSFEAWETEDGYQHIQVNPGTSLDLSIVPNEGSYSTDSPSTAVYAATFEHKSGSKDTIHRIYSFPSASETFPTNSKLKKQIFPNGSQEGKILLSTTETHVSLGFNGSGTGSDKWNTKDVTHYLGVYDTREPQLLGVAPMAGGSYLPGDSVTVALVFDEIVDSTRSTNLNQVSIVTNWGTFTYAGGADTNVLYFTGKVSDTASGALTVNSITNEAYIKDMAEDTGTSTGSSVDQTTDASLGTGDNAPTVTVGDITNANGTLTAAVSSTSSNVKLEYVWSASSAAPTTGWQTVASGSTVSTRQTSGTWYLHARATNGDGVTTYASKSYTFDSGVTVTLPSLTVTADNTNWAKTRNITVTRSPADAAVTVKTPDGTTATVHGSTYTATANGTYTFALESGGETITQMVTVSKLDITVPTVEVMDLTNTSHTQAVTLTVSVSDGESGVQIVTGTWSKDGDNRTETLTGTNGIYTTTSPDESGTWTLTVTAADAVGNTGTDTSSAYTISADRPGLTVTKQSESVTGVVYSYTVAANGNTGITVALPDGSTTTDLTGTFTITEPGDYLIAVTDAAGHFVSETITVTAPEDGTLDGVAPDVRLSIESEAWTNQVVTVTVSVYDAGSQGESLTASRGGRAIPLTESADEPASFTGSFSVSANGTYTVTCSDAAGNTGKGEISITNIDTTAPGITVSGNPTDWTASDVIITLVVTDGQSGAGSVEVKKDGTPMTVSGSGGTYTFTVSENGDYAVTATDMAGNAQSETVTVSKIDKGTPTLTVAGGMQSAASLDLTVSANAPGGSGVTVTVTKDGQDAGTVQNGSYTVTSTGIYTFTATTGAGLSATQKVTVHSIVFENDSAPYETHLVLSDGKVTEPAKPTKDGYTFAGWYREVACMTPWNFGSDEVTGNITLYAKWIPAAYSITYHLDGGTASGNPTSYTVETDSFTLNNPTKTGYTFAGWTGTGLDEVTDAVTIGNGSTGDRTYTATWTANTYTVAFNKNADDATGEMMAQTFIYGQKQALAANAYTRTGYTFSGWSTEADGNGVKYADQQEVENLSDTDGAAITLYAQWALEGLTVTITGAPEEPVTYGTEITLTATITHTADGLTYTYQWYKGEAALSGKSESTLTLTDVADSGSYTVKVTASDGSQSSTVSSTPVEVEVRPLGIAVTWSGLTRVYGDNEPEVSAVLSGVLGNDACTLSAITYQQGDTPMAAPTNAGEYTAKVSLTGVDAGNYILKNGTAILTIRPKSVGFTVSNNAVEGDGTTKTATVTPADNNLTQTGYTVTYRQGTVTVAAPTAVGSYEIWVEITDGNYQHTNGKTEMQVGTLTITQAPPVLYTLTFLGGEEADGTAPGALSAVANAKIILPESAFTRTNYQFTGWAYGGKTYQPGNDFTMPAQNVTFIAQWQQTYGITITVQEPDPEGGDMQTVSGAVVSLWLGANKLDEQTTGSDGKYTFAELLPGIYNLVVTKGDRTVTTMVEITAGDVDKNADLPKGATNSIVKVTEGSPDIVVGNLDTIFHQEPDNTVYTEKDQETVEAGGKVEFTFTAEEKQKTEVSKDLQKIQTVSGESNLALVMDYKLDKAVFNPDGTLDTTASKAITQANVLLEVLLPLPTELQGKDSYSVYRVHDGQAQELTMTPSADLGEYFTVSSDKTSLTLYVKCFSTYAIGYSESSGGNGGGSSGGGTSTPVYPPSIEEPEHGSVTIRPKNPEKGDHVTITPTPDDGYAVDTVIVTGPNGKEVAATPNDDGTYTFVQPSGKVTITVTFRKLNSVSDCPRDENCPMAPFTDADRNAWYHDGVHYCVEHGLMMGTSQTTFAPDIVTTRGMIVTILWRLEGSPIVGGPLDYDDVKAEDWYGGAVRWADSVGVVTGYGNGKFGPNDIITREQMAAMLWRYAGSPKVDGSLSSFTDGAQTSSWVQPAMIWAVEQSLITGAGNDRLEPRGQATRAQTATVLMRFAKDMAQ